MLGVLLARPPGGRETVGRQWGDRKTGRLTGNRKIRDGDALHHVEGRLLKAHDAAKVGAVDVRVVEDGVGDGGAAEGRAEQIRVRKLGEHEVRLRQEGRWKLDHAPLYRMRPHSTFPGKAPVRL